MKLETAVEFILLRLDEIVRVFGARLAMRDTDMEALTERVAALERAVGGLSPTAVPHGDGSAE